MRNPADTTDSSSTFHEAELNVPPVTTDTLSFEPPPLPEGWVIIRHQSGADVYLHKQSRTCTWSRPYTTPGNKTIKKHRIPVHSIPCLEQWLFQKERTPLAQKWHEDAGNKLGLLVKLEPHWFESYVKLRWPDGVPNLSQENQHLEDTSKETQEKRKKRKEANVKPMIVPETIYKMLDIKVPKCYRNPNPDGKIAPAVWKINTLNGPVSLLYDFCSHYLRSDLEFITKEIECSQTPYLCIAVIGKVEYANGKGRSKKTAKKAAAESTLELFLPGAFTDLFSMPKHISDKEFQYLSSIAIDDPKAIEILNQAGLPTPWQILRECCQRRKGSYIGEPVLTVELIPVESNTESQSSLSKDESMATASITSETISSSSSKDTGKSSFGDKENTTMSGQQSQFRDSEDKSGVQSWYVLKCGESLEVTGPCLGRRNGQQLAAQAMLKLIHPHLHTWDTLLKLYADTHSTLPRLVEEREYTALNYLSTSENNELLKQLKEEMRKLADKTSTENLTNI